MCRKVTSRLIQHLTKISALRLQYPGQSYCKILSYTKNTICTKPRRSAVNKNPETRRFHGSVTPLKVLGIETSCDDTGAAIVDEDRNVLGEALNSQTQVHVQHGGIIPTVAQDLHKINIEDVVTEALEKANMTIKDVDAIATTVKPGMGLSLRIGLEYGKKLVRESGKPFIPIHHMEAHALTVRLIEKVDFPYLVFLLSGGHCLLAVVRDVEDFLLLGTTLDDAPGDVYDKVARKLNLKLVPECHGLSGGAAVELLAQKGDPTAFEFPHIRTQHRDCNFSFVGIRTFVERLIEMEEEKFGIKDGSILPNVSDVCASFQYCVLRQLAKRLQVALLYCEIKSLLPVENKMLVLSGGVASNMFIRQGLSKLCRQHSCHVVCPPPRLCTDNGVMIAWNGVEKFSRGLGVVSDFESVRFQPKSPLGVDMILDVQSSYIKPNKVNLLDKHAE
ncbi:probable tRNA N6-adenosine threonylcarbamoyltransferase, mitochondrial [Lingula anatina]|uniref:N(6)-L-threonylcarbamoyladenine synthase n=1 Tax=Lingula anatina TaxID=7574 RepID=A0A2R2MRT2_LINAN|nr:probable tRNA N6-adenosine threonylcarbamoyltransferase, mitochondrial [Lingula anatina]|eukprot:XP_023932712.1 probable tRNA N6-adenosine threonylcarbamoyltransferase, mitochondrial [Lingula anatina]